MLYIGIDYSINSTAMCVKKCEETTFYVYNRHILPKNMITKLETTKINLRFTESLQKKEYSDLENDKLLAYYRLANMITEDIYKEVGNEEFEIGLEGLALHSLHPHLDLVGGNYILRAVLYQKFKKKINFFTPTEVKRFAGGGRYNKKEMLNAYIKRNENNELTKFINNFSLWKQKREVKPVSDLVDAWYLSEMVRERV